MGNSDLTQNFYHSMSINHFIFVKWQPSGAILTTYPIPATQNFLGKSATNGEI
jgi:hypothetical protein